VLIMRLLLGVFIGGAIGAVLGYFGKCSSGSCPLTANPLRGGIYGAVVGVLLASAFSTLPKDRPTPPPEKLTPVSKTAKVPKKETEIIYRVDTQAQQELAAAFCIQSIPSILFVPLNDKPQMVVGALPKKTLEKAMKDVLKID